MYDKYEVENVVKLKFEQLEDRNLLSVSPVSVDIPVGNSTSYMLTDHWGGTWSDAEKSPSDDQDDNHCWAAAASNVLEWTGWIEGLSLDATTDDAFQYFQDHWTPDGGMMNYALDWWFDGTNDSQGMSGGWAQVDVPGGGFYPEEDFSGYFHEETDDPYAMIAIDDYLHAGYGTTIAIYTWGGAHAITVWGYDYNPDNPDEYLGIWVTDSDNSKNVENAPDILRYYDVENTAGKWYLQDYYGNSGWSIGRVLGLAPIGSTPTQPPPAPNEIHGTVFDDIDNNGAWDSGELGREGDTVFIDKDGNGRYDKSHFESNQIVDIFDRSVVTSELVVVDGPLSIEDINVNINIEHTYDNDLDIYLISPSGVQVSLISHVGGSGDNFVNTTLDDEALISIHDGQAPFTDRFQPTSPLSMLKGKDANGTWGLQIFDTADLDTGRLLNWSLEFSLDIGTTTDAYGNFSFMNLNNDSYIIGHQISDLSDGFRVIDVADSLVFNNANFGVLPDFNGVAIYGTGEDDRFVYESGYVTFNGVQFYVDGFTIGFYGGGGVNTIDLMPPTPPVSDFVDEILSRNTPDLFELPWLDNNR